MFNKEWIKNVKIKEDRVIAKLYDNTKTFKGSVVIPTAYYPLCNNEIRVFHADNCKEITDEKILSILDKVEYKVGHCYTNSEELCRLLKEAGYDAKTYSGWFFICESEYPVHHAWVVVGDSVIDLTDDFTMMCSDSDKWSGIGSKEKWGQQMVDFYKEINDKQIPNSVRIAPVGVPTSSFLYVGCESNPLQAKMLWNDLMATYPNHTTRRHNSKGITPTQQYVMQRL